MPERITGEASQVVAVPIADVYAYLVDFSRHSEWTHNLDRVWQVSDGPIQVGTHFRAQEWAPPVSRARRLASMVFFIAGLAHGAQAYSESEITDLEPCRRIAWSAWVPGRRAEFNRSEWELVLTPTAAGKATLIEQRFCYLPQTAAARRMLRVLGDSDGLKAGCATNLQRLKSVLESTR